MTGGRSARSPAAGYLPAPMRALQVQHRPQRHNAVGVDGGMTAVVMLLDVVEIHHVSNTLPLVQLAGVGPEVNVVRQPRSEERRVGDVGSSRRTRFDEK